MKRLLIWLLALICALALLPAALAEGSAIAIPVAQDTEMGPDGYLMRYTSYEVTQTIFRPVTLLFDKPNPDEEPTKVTLIAKVGEVTYFFFVTQCAEADDRFAGGGIDANRGVYPAVTAYDLPLLNVSMAHEVNLATGGVKCQSGDVASFEAFQRGGSLTLTYNETLHFNIHGEVIDAQSKTVSIAYNVEFSRDVNAPEFTGAIALPTYEEWQASQQ